MQDLPAEIEFLGLLGQGAGLQLWRGRGRGRGRGVCDSEWSGKRGDRIEGLQEVDALGAVLGGAVPGDWDLLLEKGVQGSSARLHFFL